MKCNDVEIETIQSNLLATANKFHRINRDCSPIDLDYEKTQRIDMTEI
jgi:hypothetical protein